MNFRTRLRLVQMRYASRAQQIKMLEVEKQRELLLWQIQSAVMLGSIGVAAVVSYFNESQHVAWIAGTLVMCAGYAALCYHAMRKCRRYEETIRQLRQEAQEQEEEL